MTQPITDLAAFLGEARQAVEDLDRMEAEYDQLELEEKQLRRQLDSEKKAVDTSVSQTVKKRREEIHSSYDKQIVKEQERLKKVKSKREKAKNQGMKERIGEETAGLREANRQLALKLKSLFQKERMPLFCRRTWYYALYMPRTLKEISILLAVILLVFAALPWGIHLLIPEEARRSWMLILIYLADIILFGGAYLALGNGTKLRDPETIRQGRKLRDAIGSNQKKIRKIARSIRRDRNEAVYDLDQYDDQIARISQELADLSTKKQEALNTFNTVTQTIISDEIISNSKDKIELLSRDLARTEDRTKELEQKIKELSLQITDRYESYIGKEFLQPDRLAELARLIRTGQAFNLTDAIAVYKDGKL